MFLSFTSVLLRNPEMDAIIQLAVFPELVIELELILPVGMSVVVLRPSAWVLVYTDACT